MTIRARAIGRDDGFTPVEVSIVLLTLVTLGAIMLPQLGNLVRIARIAQVREDLGAICSGMKKMLDEVRLGAFHVDPGSDGYGEDPVGLLVGPGSTPARGSKGSGRSGIRGDEGQWQLQVRDRFEVDPDGGSHGNVFWVDRFENHLQQNMPLNGARYATPYDSSDRREDAADGAFFGWRGPYMDRFTADPWGNRYAANVFALYEHPASSENGGIHTSAVVCYSAGPDGRVGTTFNQPSDDADGDGFHGWRFMDDDLGVVLSAGGRESVLDRD